jgi:hypothetical protein
MSKNRIKPKDKDFLSKLDKKQTRKKSRQTNKKKVDDELTFGGIDWGTSTQLTIEKFKILGLKHYSNDEDYSK